MKIFLGWSLSACSSRTYVSWGMGRVGEVEVMIELGLWILQIYSSNLVLCFFVGYSEAANISDK